MRSSSSTRRTRTGSSLMRPRRRAGARGGRAVVCARRCPPSSRASGCRSRSGRSGRRCRAGRCSSSRCGHDPPRRPRGSSRECCRAASGGNRVDLLVAVLADVGDVHPVRLAVEGDAPRVPQAVGIDAPAGADRPRIEAEKLPVAAPEILRAPAGVAGPAAVALGGDQPAVGREDEAPAVVNRRGLVERKQLAPGALVHGGVGGVGRVTRDARVAVVVRVVDVDEVVRLVLRGRTPAPSVRARRRRRSGR